jgi:secreted trypsin-like serine protease
MCCKIISKILNCSAQDVFQGDTGSPLVYLIKFGNALLQGVSSFVSGRGCESTDPSGYTRVFAYADWIINITGVQPR